MRGRPTITWSEFHPLVAVWYCKTHLSSPSLFPHLWRGDNNNIQFSSVTQLCPTLRPHELQHSRPPCPSPAPGVNSNSCPSSRWCHLAISSSVVPFSSWPQPLPAPESFPISQLYAWGGQSTGVSALVSFLPKNTQDWSPLGWTGCISLQFKGLSKVFSSTTVQKHQFFGAQLSSHCYPLLKSWNLEKATPLSKIFSYFLDFETGACSLHFYIPSLRQLGTRTSEAKASLHSPISFILETLFSVPSTGVPAWMQASGFFPLRRNSSLPRARLTLLLLMGINLSIATPHSYPFIQQDVF